MKIECYILQKNNSIIKRVVKNPSFKFEVTYTVDNDSKSYTYEFDREKMFELKTLFSKKKILFYEHGTMQPLSPKFMSSENKLDALNMISKSNLLKELFDSTKSNTKFNYFFILGIIGIIGLVLIVVFG